MPDKKTMLDHALDLWENGYNVIPLGDGGTKQAKLPREQWKQYQDAPATDIQITAWWEQWPNANIGILTGNITVVDADSAEAVEEVKKHYPHTPRRVKTSKGMHFYYKANDNEPIRNSANQNSKIDIRGIGGYVVAPPSTHEAGEQYVWDLDFGVSSDINDLHIIKSSELSITQPTLQSAITGNLNFDVSKYKPAQTETPVPPGGRNVAAASLAGKYIKSGDSIQEALQKLDIWNNQNPIPLNQEELKTTVVSVARTHASNTNQSVNILPFTPPINKRAEENKVFTLDEFGKNPPEPPEIFWRDAALFRGARMLVAGGAKKGKSSFAMHMAKAAATGGEFLGHKFTKPLRVVWLQAEIQKAWLKVRFDAMTKNMHHKEVELLNKSFYASGRLRIDAMNNEQWEQTILMLKPIKPDLVIIDPVINFFPGGNENDNAEMHGLLERFDSLEDHFDCALIALHHLNKGDTARDSFESIRGASAIRGWYDTGILLSACKGAPVGTVTISYELRNGAPLESHSAIYNHTAGEWQGTLQKQYEEAVKPAKELTRLDADHNKNVLLNIIKDNGGISSKQIIELAKDEMFLIKGRMNRYSVRALKDLVSKIKEHKSITTAKHGASVRHFYEDKSEVKE